MSAADSTRLERALRLASMGLYLFPLRENSKLPALKDFSSRATRNPAQLREWFGNDRANIGVIAGKFDAQSAAA